MTYLDAASVPLTLSQKCRVAPPIRTIAQLPHTYTLVPSNIASLISFDFALESTALADAASLSSNAQQRASRFSALAESRIRRKQDELNAKAPGYTPDNLLVPLSSTVTATTADALASLSLSSTSNTHDS
ncbi:hypothetical protein BCR33DRAFT_724556 [Rhizoclosmatium globosum]|uniref:Uncharacterized protein n=1 Tax=Rhizoclosmatium globosum TaxID=329046 RepID=A0A1Y2B526_9FUNG|nr:hypothetical protein BCR33DRAFT_724556 [Rhizoclosmatium globosum]|eukprot:ORY29938.1 hypothetical protein BCR33DRAFT_724556 [Rhizoclosmatium globosum]